MFEPVNPKVDIQKIEGETLEFWRNAEIFQRSMQQRLDADAPRWVTYEGPPTVNGTPGVHHVLARAFKDMFPRYKSMRGYYVLRKGGWDTHGLPVEIAMEKALGFKSKNEIEAYGIGKFNDACRQSVIDNIDKWERFTERMAYWTSLPDAYRTYTNDYVESVWWVLSEMFNKGLIYQGFRIVPFCTRCGTPLSSHELSLGYEDVKDPSVYVRFKLADQLGVSFLVWTTTPWTLPANVALAVGADIEYVQVQGPAADGTTEQLILAEARLSTLKNAEVYTIVKRMKGSELLGQHYTPLYSFVPVEQDYAYVVAGDFVSTGDGTGIVHIAPAYGADDLKTGQEKGLPFLRLTTPEGKFIDEVTTFAGQWFKDSDTNIIIDLKQRGLMYKSEKYEHSYPHCWRDGTPLMYVARDSWYIRSTDHREDMVRLNQTINWVPGHIRDGRFGNWLDELKDWSLGRERYWGTPLPIWLDDQTGEAICVGSVAQLSQLTGRDLSSLDLHRPHVDEISFPNPDGKGGTMRRVPEVIDVWFDSGAMPVAQWGYPAHNREMFEEQYPADYICEAIDQTRGWFYTLHAISTMVFNSVAYKNVICLGHILDKDGFKMSKSKGNVVDPWDVMNKHGSDAMRWYIYTSGQPGDSRRFSVDLVGEVVKQFWGTLWNTYSFFVTYANIAKWSPLSDAPAVADRDPLDRWLLAALHDLTKDVTDAYEQYDVPRATRPIQYFVIEDLSNWYVRLSRRRFWDGDPSAMATLYEALVMISKLLAPSMPMVADHLYRHLVAAVDSTQPESVHLADWPAYDASLIDPVTLHDMALAQKLVSLGRAARESVEIGVRQPLASAQFVTRNQAETEAVEKLADVIATELNVKHVTTGGAEGAISYKLNPLPQALGKKFGKDFPRVQRAMREGDPDRIREWAIALKNGESVTVGVDGDAYIVTPDECQVMQGAAEGYAVAEDNGLVAVLDTRLNDDLRQEGLAREVVRRVQATRRDAGFEIEDRIHLVYEAGESLAQAIERFGESIKDEVLALSITRAAIGGDGFRADFLPHDDPKQDLSIRGEALSISVKKA